MEPFSAIRLEKRNDIGYITLNRPEVRNAFNQEMIDETQEALREIDKDHVHSCPDHHG